MRESHVETMTVQEVREHLADLVRVVAQGHKRVQIANPNGDVVLVSKIDKPDQIEAIQKLIRDEFGVDVNVRCVVTTAKGKIPPNVPQDGMVATAIQHGGQIVDM